MVSKQMDTETISARSKTHTVTVQLGDTYNVMVEKMLESLAKFQKEGRGWRLRSIKGGGGVEVFLTKFEPLRGVGYRALPPFVARKKAVINIRNKDDLCFKWAVTRALHPVEDHAYTVTELLREQSKGYNWEGVTFPTKVKNIGIWEDNNNVNVNLFGNDDEKIYTIRIGERSEGSESSETINLFLHDDNHYCVVKDLSRLVASQLSKKEHVKHICLRCLNAFGSEELLSTHEELCSEHKLQHHVYPKPGETTSFKTTSDCTRSHSSCIRRVCFVKPTPTKDKDPSKSYTTKY